MRVLLRITAILVVLLVLWLAIRDWLAAHDEALVILGAAAVAFTVVLGVQSLVSLQKKWPESSGVSRQKKREQRYFGLRRPTHGGRHWRDLAVKEAELTEQYGNDAISHLGLSAPTFNQLKAAKLVRISELVAMFEEDPEGSLIYARCRLFGTKKMAELKEKLNDYLDRQAADPEIRI